MAPHIHQHLPGSARLCQVAAESKKIIGYFLDTKGPEVRTSMLKDGKDIFLVAGAACGDGREAG